MKLRVETTGVEPYYVAPHAGVWIEIMICPVDLFNPSVTPLVGVWIEILRSRHKGTSNLMSLPTRECGLKYKVYYHADLRCPSLPTRECGLKYRSIQQTRMLQERRSPRGSVD